VSTANRNCRVARDWAKALIYYALSAYPGLKSGAIVQEVQWSER
jgi:hypothetical protein